VQQGGRVEKLPPFAPARYCTNSRCGNCYILCRMSADFAAIFSTLKPVMAEQARRLAVQKDTAIEYSLVTKGPSPFPQHKGQPMWFGAVKQGKAYVSFHLMPLYMSPTLEKQISPALKKRMQGKTCFNFKTTPDAELIADLKRLTAAAAGEWARFTSS
jgi:hypothetical protein